MLAILRAYYPSAVGMVREVTYRAPNKGLTTHAANGPSATGSIEVGDKFLDQAPTGFARRALQVGHELEHIAQHPQQMGGPGLKAQREFLAFAHEALAHEATGTGRLPHKMRVDLIDAALGNYFCMTPEQQTANGALKSQLLTERAQHDGVAGNPVTAPPATCRPTD